MCSRFYQVQNQLARRTSRNRNKLEPGQARPAQLLESMVLVDVTLERGSGCRRPGQGDGKGKAASRLISVASGSDLVKKRMAVQNCV